MSDNIKNGPALTLTYLVGHDGAGRGGKQAASAFQPSDAGLASIAGLTTSADKLIYTTASDVYATTPLTAAARTVLDDTTTAAMLTTLGAQPVDADLTALAALASATDTVPYATGVGTWALAAFTAVGRAVVGAATAALQRTALGLTAAATAAASIGGTWTPVLSFGGLSVGIAYTTQTGTYVRIGPLIFWQMRIVLTSKGSSTGAAVIAGLPAVAGSDHQRGDVDAYANMASITPFFGLVSSGTSAITLVTHGTATQTNMTDANFLGTGTLVMSGVLNTGSLT